MKDDPTERREQEFDAITFLLAGVLISIVLGAVGYGIYNSSSKVASVPTLTTGAPVPTGPGLDPSRSTTGSR